MLYNKFAKFTDLLWDKDEAKECEYSALDSCAGDRAGDGSVRLYKR